MMQQIAPIGIDVEVQGELIGNVNARCVKIGDSATLLGSITAQQVEVLGTVEGSIRSQSIRFGPHSVVRGDLYYERLAIGLGATFSGRCFFIGNTF